MSSLIPSGWAFLITELRPLCALQMLVYEFTSLAKQTWLESSMNLWHRNAPFPTWGNAFYVVFMWLRDIGKCKTVVRKVRFVLQTVLRPDTSSHPQWDREELGFDRNKADFLEGRSSAGWMRTLLLSFFEVKGLNCGLGQCLWEGGKVSVCRGLGVCWVYSAESSMCIPATNAVPTLIFY